MAEVNCILGGRNFLVPCDVVEQYLNECSEYQLKLLLLVLENPKLTEEELAERLSLTVQEIELDLKFWLARGVLEKKEEKHEKIKTEFFNLKLTTKELTQILNESKELKFIIEQLPAILGRLPNQFDMLNVIDFNLNLDMQPELILYLLKYCATIGKKSAQAIKNQAKIWFELNINSLESAEEYIKKAHDKGLRLIGELTPYIYGWNSYMSAFEIFEYAQELGMTVSCHPTSDEDMIAFAKAFPNMEIVYAHPGEKERLLFYADILNKFDNVYLDISGTGVGRYGAIRELINKAGKEKILFGTDYSVCNPAMYVSAVMYEKLTDDERECILYKNAERVFKLK